MGVTNANGIYGAGPSQSFFPEAAVASLTDNSGGTPSNTIADVAGSLAQLTDNTGGTASPTELVDVSDGAGKAKDAETNDNFASLNVQMGIIAAGLTASDNNNASLAAKVEAILDVLRADQLILS